MADVLTYWANRLLHPKQYQTHMDRVRELNTHLDHHIPSLGGTRDPACPGCQENMKRDDDDRPDTVAEMLVIVAEYLALGDRLVREAAARKGDDLVMGTGVQDDVRLLADWLAEHPVLDKMIYTGAFLGATVTVVDTQPIQGTEN